MGMIFDYFRFFLILGSFISTSATRETIIGPEQTAPDSTSVTLLFAGDIMQHTPQIAAAQVDDSTWDYHPCFQYVAPIISQADVAIANLEVTLAGPPYTGYPQFSAPDHLAVAARDAGFDVLCTANNHSCDRGDAGIIRTTRILDSLGIIRTGTFRDSMDFKLHHPLIITKNDITFALLNYTYGTNGLPFSQPAMVNLIDNTQLINDLEDTRKRGIDFIIVYFHWGIEYQSHPSVTQEKLAQLCYQNGVDVVMGSHPHVLQRMEYFPPTDSLKHGTLTAYSLGNYVSNQRPRFRDGGAMISFTLSKTWNNKQVLEPHYHLTWVHTPYENGQKKYYILPVKQFEQDTTLGKPTLEKLWQFADDSRNLLNTQNFKVPEK